MSDWFVPDDETEDVKTKVIEGKSYRNTVNIPIGDSSFELSYRLLPQRILKQKVLPKIDFEALAEYYQEHEDEDDTTEQRLQELQEQEDELSEDEEEELQRLHREVVHSRAGIMNEIGEGMFEAFEICGREGLVADEEDIQNALDMGPTEMVQRFKDIEGSGINEVRDIDGLTRDDAKRAIEAEMQQVLEDDPYETLYTVGRTVFEESRSVGGNSDDGSTAGLLS